MRYGKYALSLAVAALLAWSAGDAAAQERWTFDGRGGVGIPTGDLEELTDVGASLGLGIAYWLSPRVAFRVDGDVDNLSGSAATDPDFRLWHFNGGFEFRLTEPTRSPWNISVNVGGGGTTIDTDDFTLVGPEGAVTGGFTQTYPALNGGLKIGYGISRNVDIFVNGGFNVTFTDDDDTIVFSQINPAVDPDGFSTAVVIPITAGFRIKI